jgi:hypothetical protein
VQIGMSVELRIGVSVDGQVALTPPTDLKTGERVDTQKRSRADDAATLARAMVDRGVWNRSSKSPIADSKVRTFALR